MKEVRRQGAVAIDGREALLYQALPQFRLMTGVEMSIERARKSLEREED